MLGFLSGMGWQELLILFGLALLIFGGKRIPEIGRGVARGIVEFKKGLSGAGEATETLPRQNSDTH